MTMLIEFENDSLGFYGWVLDSMGHVINTLPVKRELFLGCRVNLVELQEGERLEVCGRGSDFPITVKVPVKSIKYYNNEPR